MPRSAVSLTVDVCGVSVTLPDPSTYPTAASVYKLLVDAELPLLLELDKLGGYAGTITITATTGAANKVRNTLARAVRKSLKHTSGRVISVYTTKIACHLCGARVKTEALDDHAGSLLCDEVVRRMVLKDHGYRRIGRTWKTIEKAQIDTIWLAHGGLTGMSEKGDFITGDISYVRCAPGWATTLADITLVDHELRVVVLNHCNEHPAAREGLLAAIRLGPVGSRATLAHTKSVPTATAKRVMSDLFEDALRITGV